MTAWTSGGVRPYTACTAECDGGIISEEREVSVFADHGGAECPPTNANNIERRETVCNTEDCPVDCVMSQWTGWGQCSTTCGNGQQHRTREVTTEMEHGGIACPTDVKETQACKVVECPIDCAYDSWSEWGTCDSSCGPGTSTRNRVVGTPAQFNGAACEGGLEEARDCEIKPCPVDCELEAWEDAGECSEPCGTGQLKQTRTIET